MDDANLSAKSTLVPDLNVTGVNVSNLSASSRYEITPMRVEVVLSDSPLPAPKGEMAAGPRSIGFFTSPESLAVLLLVVAAVAAGAWYIMKRKPDEDADEEPEKP
ncbi:MAG: hypothetical protein LUO98_05705 [Methanoregula sp.]|nr:hypothetical protein [Methanoregula sp.]